MDVSPDERLSKAIASNDLRAANKARQQGGAMPRRNMKHPIFAWLRAMRVETNSALPMLQWLVENGVDPAFRVSATADRLPRSDFSATLSNRAIRHQGDKGDSLLGRLIYCSQFEAVEWLAQRVPVGDLLHTHGGAVHTLKCPLERVMIAGQWEIVSTMLDRLQDYPIGDEEADCWQPIHDRALKVQLSRDAPSASAQERLHRIFKMSRATGAKLPSLPANSYAHAVPQTSLAAWSLSIPGPKDFLLDKGRRRQRDGWDMLFSSPGSYRDPSGLLHGLLADPRFSSVATRQYQLAVGRSSDSEASGTLCDMAMSGETETASPEDREIIVDLLRSAGCLPSRAPGVAFKQIMAKGRLPGDAMLPAAWSKYPGELPVDALAFCRRASQFKQLISWGLDPATRSVEGVPAVVGLLISMRQRQSSNNLRDLAIEVATFLSHHQELLELSCPSTGETVADLAWMHTSISSRVATVPSPAQITPWSLVSACVAGQKFDHRLMNWLRTQKGNTVVLPGTDMSPWFACILHETSSLHRRTYAQQSDAKAGRQALAPLGRWPGGCPMEGFRRLTASRGLETDRRTLQKTSFAGYFEPGILSKSITTTDDIALIARTSVAEGGEMIKLLQAEIPHMDTPARVELFCSWSSSALELIGQPSEDEACRMELSTAIPHESIIELLDRISQDVDIDGESLDRIAASGRKLAQAEQEDSRPNEDFLSDLNMRISHLSMHRNTQKTPTARAPGKRF